MAPTDNNDRPFARTSAPKLRRTGPAEAVPVRVEFGSDSSTSITSLRTPEPLPPSPGAQDPDQWLEQVRTNPAALAPDLGALAGGVDAESHPGWTGSRPGLAVHDENVAHGDDASPEPSHFRWLLPMLLAATCLAVGMVLGALLQSRLGSPRTVIECPEPGVTP